MELKRSNATTNLCHLFKKDRPLHEAEDIFYKGSPPDTEEFYEWEISEYKKDELNFLRFQAKLIHSHYCARELETVKRAKSNGVEYHTTRNSTPGYFIEYKSDTTTWSSMDVANGTETKDNDEMQF
jgi:hypothetical protein